MSAGMKLGENTNTLRVVTLAISFLFIPAFLYGLASIWAIVFGVTISLLFNARLQDIIGKCTPIENEGKRCAIIIAQYLLLALEMVFITSVAPIFFLYSGMEKHSAISALDAQILDYSPLNYLVEQPYESSLLNVQILIAATMPIFISFFMMLALSFKKMMKVASWINYSEASTVEKGQKKYNPVITSWHHQWSSGGTVYALIITLLYVESFRGLNNVDYITDYGLILRVLSGYFVLCIALLLNFTSYASIKK
ncbi:MAG: hypothetical protein R3E13_01995 [Alphaproteobacteria bacterium]